MRWQRLQQLFAQALALPPAARAAFLDAACGGDAPLRSELDRLLRGHAHDDATVQQTIRAAALRLADDAAQRRVGQRLGPWRLTAHLADGGMGAVYRAERADGQYAQQVAVKLLNPAWVSDDAKARFEGERQILARLAHPLIARLLDGGRSDDGVPYLVMEYVDGEPIDAWCVHRRLPTPERLRLFVQVCRAVEHAHRNLVVHRDLKPGNILVDAGGTPRLLDFGIAKLIDESPALTRTGERVLTPSHASPEQITGGSVTTATDVYALGVLLYDLLAGHPPYGGGTHPAELARQIVYTVPPRPSSVVGASRRRLARELKGDLDNIVLMALRKEPERRYPSAAALADDVQRHLANLPVHARADSLPYRSVKFWRRHPLAVPVSAAVLVLAVGAGTAFTGRLAAERDAARRAEATAEQASAFLERLFTGADPVATRGERPTLEQLLDAGAARAERELADAPPVLARMLHALGSVRLNLNDYAGAEPLLARAHEIRRGLLPADDPAAVQTMAALGRVQLALARHEQARPLLEAVLAQARSRTPPDPAAVAEALHDLAQLDHQTGAAERAVERIDEALALLPRDAEHEYREAVMLNSAGMARTRAGDTAGAVAAFERSLALHAAAGRTSDPGVAAAHANLATLLFPRGEVAQAETHFLAALALLRARADGGGAVQNAILATNLGRLYMETGRLDDAQRWALDAVAHGAQAFGEQHPQYAILVVNLASLRRAQRRFDEAEALLRRADAVFDARPDIDRGWPQASRIEAAWLALDRGQPARAERLARQVLDGMQAQPHLAARCRGPWARALLGTALLRQGRLDAAGPLLEAAHAQLAAERLPAQPLARWVRERLAEWHAQRGDTAAATRLRGA